MGFGSCRFGAVMRDVSFLTAVKTKSFLHMAFAFFSGKLTIFSQLIGDQVLRLILRGAFGVLEDDDELVLLEELVVVLEGELLELEDLEESFLLGFPIFPEFFDSRRVASSCIQWILSASCALRRKATRVADFPPLSTSVRR